MKKGGVALRVEEWGKEGGKTHGGSPERTRGGNPERNGGSSPERTRGGNPGREDWGSPKGGVALAVEVTTYFICV